MFIRAVMIGLIGLGLVVGMNRTVYASTSSQFDLNGEEIEEIVINVVDDKVTSYNAAPEQERYESEEQQFYGIGLSPKSINADNLQSVIVNGEISATPTGVSLGMFRLTSYCGCSICNGKWVGSPTAFGTSLTTGRTIAVDKRVIPLGSWVEINIPGVGWQKFRAEDTGSGVKGNHIDVYIGSVHQECYNGLYNGMAEVRLLTE